MLRNKKSIFKNTQQQHDTANDADVNNSNNKNNNVGLNDTDDIPITVEEGVQKYEKFIRVAVHNKNNNNNLKISKMAAPPLIAFNRTVSERYPAAPPTVQKKRNTRKIWATIESVASLPTV
ncbi:hypothetical protein QE152_g29010 [Popillia japonica]|uniref:Uncharacterized protein n=1 Tax=Popillia japonica TaxID=7064 RepID=A0AAW1JJ07_POPJA